MTNCNCDMIPIYIMSIFIGLLIGTMTTNNLISNSMGYWTGQLAYYEMDLINHPQTFYTNPFFIGIVGLIAIWQRNKIMNIPWSIYYHLNNSKSDYMITDTLTEKDQ